MSDVDPKVLEMRRLMAERYKKARPEDRPQVQLCPDCGKSDCFGTKICPVTGKRRDADKVNFVGGTAVDKDKRVFTSKELVQAINAVRVKWQPARVAKVRVDSDAAGIFQTFVLQREWKMMRYGIMYGTVDKATAEVTIHCVYEPEQVGLETRVETQKDARVERVDALAGYLGLQRVGVVLTHPPRDTDECTLEAHELLMLAKEQSIHGDHCILLAIAPNPASQEIEAHAWQASEQCVQLFQVGMLKPSEEDTRFVHSTRPLEIAQEDRDARGREKCIIKEGSNEVDAHWMTAYVAVEAVGSDLIGNRFVRITRPGEMPPTFANLRRFLDDPKRKSLPLVEQLRDFHVLVFLMENVFDWKCDMPAIAEAVVTRNKNGLAAYETVLREYMRSAGN
jgi:nuclear protein localization family protein 4